MELKLYKTSDAANVINKTLTGVETLSITLKRDTNILTPVLFLTPEQSLNYFDFNYCEITELGRKYFISSVEMVSNNLYRLDCECDYLETYKADILASKARVMRKIETGDYGETELSFTGEVTVTTHESDVTLEPFDNSLLTVIRWA